MPWRVLHVIETDPRQFDPHHPTVQMLLWAYRQGVFPMAEIETDEIHWYCPDPRGLIPLDDFRVPKSLARVVRNGNLDIRSDTAFESVIRACAEPRRDGSWISERLIEVYLQLHSTGNAHSVEAWRENRLVGGLYGVHIGGAFFGESMFSHPEQGGRDASKVCLVQLVAWMRSRGFLLLDTQFRTPHLDQFGCIEIPRQDYLTRLSDAVKRDVTWGSFHPLEEDRN